MHPPPHLTDLAALRAAWAEGVRPELLFFWGHTPRGDGRVGAACLSQWYAAPFTVKGRLYPTAEHWMMAGKARLFGDDEAFEAVFQDPSPAAAKRIGRRVRGFDERAWAAERRAIVVEGNRHKFRRYPELAAFLGGTGAAVLVEASPYDRIWGIGLRRDDPRAVDPARWQGQNLLGFALMDVRAGLS